MKFRIFQTGEKIACIVREFTSKMWKGYIFKSILVLSISFYGAGQRQGYDICGALLRCLDTSLLCPYLFSYHKCVFGPTPPEPRCGESFVTGKAEEYSMLRVVGGSDAIDKEFPWTVHVRVKNSIFIGCSGSIIGRNVVITAAHCILTLVSQPDRVEVGYGSTNRSLLSYVQGRRIVMHPDYNQINSDNDIALIFLSEDLPLDANTNLRSICLPQPGSAYPDSPECIISGWGVAEDYEVPAILQKASVPLVQRDVCKRAYEGYPFLVSDRQICAGFYEEGGVDACQGDSGGPLFCPVGDQWVLYGVVSVGNQCALPKFPGVYAFVPHHVTWITFEMNEL